MTKDGKPIRKHIAGLGDVVMYDNVPDAKEASMYQERPQVHVAGGQKQSVGDEYHTRVATPEELQAATAKALAQGTIAPAAKPALDRSGIADSITRAVVQQSKHNVPVPDGHTHPNVPDNPVKGELAENAPDGADAKKRAKRPVLSQQENDHKVEDEVDEVEPVDERYGTSAEPSPRKEVTTPRKVKSLGEGDRVYVPGAASIGFVDKIDGDKLEVELEGGRMVSVQKSEVTPLKTTLPKLEEKGYGSDSKKKKMKKHVGPNGMTVSDETESKPTKSEADDDEDPKE